MQKHGNNRQTTGRRNCVSTVTIQLTTTKQIAEALDRLAETGLFGANRAAAAERLMSEQVRMLLRDGIISKISKDLPFKNSC